MRRPFEVVRVPGAVVAAVAAALVAAVLLCSCHATAPATGAGTGAVNDPANDVARRWTAFERSGVLTCLGPRVEQQAVVLSAAAVRRASGAALAGHADLRAASHAAARTIVLLAARRPSTSTHCGRRVTGAVRGMYAVSVAPFSDRPTVWRGAALGDLAARHLAASSRSR